MLSAGEGWGEGNKPHRIRLDYNPLPNPLPRTIPATTRDHIAGEGTDRSTFKYLCLEYALLVQGQTYLI
jgi:hypothetical protein